MGGVAAFIWLFISNTILPLKSNIIHKVAPNQIAVHEILTQNINAPGTYTVPYVDMAQESSMDDYRNMPVYSVTYAGYTHGDTGSPADLLIPIVLIFVTSFLATAILRMASPAVNASFLRRMMFITGIGFLVVLSDDFLQVYMGPQPGDYLIFLAISNILTWFFMALVIAWKSKPVIANNH